jgi:hypothetical protein
MNEWAVAMKCCPFILNPGAAAAFAPSGKTTAKNGTIRAEELPTFISKNLKLTT